MKLPLFKIHWDDDDLHAVNRVIEEGGRWCIGPDVVTFEQRLCQDIGINNCITYNSGGSALHALMIAHGIGPSDEVIVPSFTFIATAMAPLYVGARPVFADIEEMSLGLDPDDVLNKITPRTRALMPIHFGGFPCLVNDLREIAEDAGLIFIEDAAEAYGAEVNGRRVGTLSDSAIFSFCQNKIFTTGEGGCAVTNDDNVARKLRLVQSYGRQMDGDYFSTSEGIDYVDVGYNWRMSSMAAALGLSQLKRVDELIKRRRDNASYLDSKLSSIDGLEILRPRQEEFAVYQMYTIRVVEGKEVRDALSSYLKKRGITTKIYFDPVHNYSVFRNLGLSDTILPTTQKISSQVLTLPFYPNMSEGEMNVLVGAIEDFFEGENNE